MDGKHNLIAYLATIAAIVVLSLAGTAVCMLAPVSTEVNLARIIGGLAFIGAAVAGLVGIAGTFKANGQQNSAQSDANLATALDKVPPATTGTGPAKQLGTEPASYDSMEPA